MPGTITLTIHMPNANFSYCHITLTTNTLKSNKQ